jgi:hypothetical protein
MTSSGIRCVELVSIGVHKVAQGECWKGTFGLLSEMRGDALGVSIWKMASMRNKHKHT